MMTWRLAVAASLILLAGCGGGFRGGLVPGDTDTYQTAPPPDAAELMSDELSAQRLEELYAKSRLPGWDPALEEELRRWEHQVKFDMPVQVNRQVRAYLVYFSTERKDKFRLYLARSTRYLPMIKETFGEYGLPEDLAYLALIESGFNPDACSRAGACGMWQFIRSTGRRYGLEVNDQVDERRDPRKSTRAAARYLADLYRQFGSWYLAAASYNCGERRVQEELSRNRHKNFWQLYSHHCLPEETTNYVPQMIAATIIAKNPAKFGFTNVAYQPPLRPDEWRGTEPVRHLALAPTGNRPAAARPSLPSSQARGRSAENGKKQLAVAQGSKSGAKVAAHDHHDVRVASVLGSSQPPAKKAAAAKDKSRKQAAAPAKPGKTTKVAAGRSSKKNHAALAKKGENKNVKSKVARKGKPGQASAT